jgi:t-SNARE complex subunit (syntaxin)
VDVAHTNATEAHGHIEKAVDHQKAGNKWLCVSVMIAGGCALFIIIILILHFTKKTN